MSNKEHFPEGLNKIYDIIIKAYPDGVPEAEDYALMHILYDYVCDENLAILFSKVTGKNYAISYNDVLKSVTTNIPSKDDVIKVKKKIDSVGFAEWIQSDI